MKRILFRGAQHAAAPEGFFRRRVRGYLIFSASVVLILTIWQVGAVLVHLAIILPTPYQVLRQLPRIASLRNLSGRSRPHSSWCRGVRYCCRGRVCRGTGGGTLSRSGECSQAASHTYSSYSGNVGDTSRAHLVPNRWRTDFRRLSHDFPGDHAECRSRGTWGRQPSARDGSHIPTSLFCGPATISTFLQ